MNKKDRLLSAVKKMQKDLKQWMPGITAASIFLFLMLFFFHGVCLSRLLFGIPCPGCGLTRAAGLLIQGNLTGSMHMHPLLIPMILNLVIYIVEYYLLNRKPVWSKRCLWLLLMAVFTVYIIRMKLYFPNKEPLKWNQDSLLSFFIKVIINQIA